MRKNAITVGFCENGAGYGGAIISLAAMLQHLSDEFEPRLYTSLDTDPYRQLARLVRWEHIAPVNTMDVSRLKSHATAFASTIDNVLNVLPHAIKYYRKFKADNVDLVYLNNDASCNIASALAAKLAGLPIVLHARGFHADTRSNRWVLSKLSHCMPVSEAVKTQLISLGLPSSKCTVVHEGLDLVAFKQNEPSQRLRAELGLQLEQPIITLVGGLIDWKGQDVLLDAAPRIFERCPNAHILLVGASYGREDTFSRLIAERITRPELKGRVSLTGGRLDIPDILQLSSVVVHASTSPEPFGRTFLEGMAMGRPVIASNEGGPLDVIEHGVDGLLIRPRDPLLLAETILSIISDSELARRLGRNAARKAAFFSIENHAEAVASVLRGIVPECKLDATNR